MKKSLFGTLNLRDAINGFITAFITAALTSVYVILQTGQLPTTKELIAIGIAGLTAGIGYLIKNVLTNSKDEFAKTESKN